MRIVVDMQGAQASNRHRGIGRLSLSLILKMASLGREHEFVLALNGAFPESIDEIREAFNGLISQDRILVWTPPSPVHHGADVAWRRLAAEKIRELFLLNLKPDVIHVTSMFEGFGDNAVTSIGMYPENVPTAVTFYDLIPLIHRDVYLKNPEYEQWYMDKLANVRRADLLLAISASSRLEGIDFLGFNPDQVVNISCAVDDRFKKIQLTANDEAALRQRYGLSRPFVLYTSGMDFRKNNEGLIRAFALLPPRIRNSYQLAIVCSANASSKEALRNLAQECGLAADDLVLSGYVSDAEAVQFYNLCSAFVFPSKHEGFGLPVLEAMACGAPVIAADNSSLPEIIGRVDAQFSAGNDKSIAEAIQKVLVDETYRTSLKRNSSERAKLYTWDRTARTALNALQDLYYRNEPQRTLPISQRSSRLRLAYVSPMPPMRTGIADYSAELLPELSQYYDIDVVVAQSNVESTVINSHCKIRSVAEFEARSTRYDRIIYHFGNSEYHAHMFDLLERNPGAVVLHDFFLSGIVAHMEIHNRRINYWTNALLESHGYGAVNMRFNVEDAADVVWKYPTNWAVIRSALGIVVHSDFQKRLANDWYTNSVSDNWVTIPLLRVPVLKIDKDEARNQLGIEADEFVICSFGFIGGNKYNDRLVEAWSGSFLAKDQKCRLVFVGENTGGIYGERIAKLIAAANSRIYVTGYAPPDTFRKWLAAADVAVQLRSNTRGETSAAVFDALNYGIATIVNAHGTLQEIPSDCVMKLDEEFGAADLSSALEKMFLSSELRQIMGSRAQAYVRKNLEPRKIAAQYAQAIERFYESPAFRRSKLINLIAELPYATSNEQSWIDVSRSLSEAFPLPRAKKQLLIDISELAQHDAKSGIQRVVRNILLYLLSNPPRGFSVEPVYATTEQTYRYARKFALKLLNCPEAVLNDDPIEVGPGDVFIGLDLQPQVIPAQAAFLASMRNQGAKVYFVVYDLLCISHPEFFYPGASELMTNWLNTVFQSDGAICISRSVAEYVAEKFKSDPPQHSRPFRVGWFHLGSDLQLKASTAGLPAGFEKDIATLSGSQSVLVVGTIEPRKGHAQVLAAFEMLWAQGSNAILVLVGKQGWMMEILIEQLRQHPRREKQLFWYEGISDEALLKLYDVSAGVLAPSEGEGFGLPLVEAAKYHKPILARDIPVFREVAGSHATYFRTAQPSELAVAIEYWLNEIRLGQARTSAEMPILSWSESADQLLSCAILDRWPLQVSRESCDQTAEIVDAEAAARDDVEANE